MFVALAFAVLTAAQQPQQPVEFSVDAGHTIVEFSVGFALSHVKGRFSQTHGTILYDSAHFERSSISIVIESNSIDTGWPHRDDHLKSDDFFDVEKFPAITFQSDQIVRRGTGWSMSGPLTMHGVTRRVSIPFALLAQPSRSPASPNLILNAEGSLRLARKDFGVLGGDKHNSWFTALRSATVSDTVDISLEIEGWVEDRVAQRPAPIDAALDRIKKEGVDAQIARMRQYKSTASPADFARTFHGTDLVVRALVGDGRTQEAVALAGAITDLYPDLASASLLNGFVQGTSGNASAAAASYARAKQVFRPPARDPNERFPQIDDTWYYADQFTRAAIDMGRARAAVPLARTMTEMYPGAARSFVTLGLALAQTGDTAGARAAYARALELDPTETRALEWKRRLAN
ncbi:MAG TPA: YceI family protein [Gemmatimonadaceae bacterium]|nr:YceI family protein [Gemmatimonadaceae bacterium]